MSAENPYDAVPYPTGAQTQTQPDRLAATAALFGMSPAPPERCRVLELGCYNGGNLIPMAAALPGSAFTGVDLSGTAIAQGRELAERVGLKNITLLQQDLLAYEPGKESFDYVIAHGVYAWVPPPVQDRVLAICGAALAPEGVAFVSYNALPGAALRTVLRDMMQYHLRGIDEPAEKLDEAKAMLDLLRRAWPEPGTPQYWVGLQAEQMLGRDRDNLLHDELEENYRPAYFHEFMAHAARHGLQYLGESDLAEMNESRCPPAGRELIAAFGPDQIVEKEQYLDFLKFRTFRQTLLCRSGRPLKRDGAGAGLDRFGIETRAQAAKAADGSVQYRTAKGVKVTASDPLFLAMMARLDAAAPWPVPFRELLSDGMPEADLRRLVLRLVESSVLGLRLRTPACVRMPGERPEASRLARVQVERRPVVTTLLHADLNLAGSPLPVLIRLLDGTRTRADLLRDLAAAGVSVTPDGLEQALAQLARLAVLTA